MNKAIISKWLSGEGSFNFVEENNIHFVFYHSEYGDCDVYMGKSLDDIIKKYWIDYMLNSPKFNEEEINYLEKIKKGACN